MTKKPIIGITMTYGDLKYSEGPFLNHAYHESVIANGGIPVLIPFTNPEIAVETLQLCDGVILSGGEDVDPQFYNQDPHKNIGATIPERDIAEAAIIREALDKDIPLLAICRGIQMLNVTLGGTIIQDIHTQTDSTIQHTQRNKRHIDTHNISVDQESKLYDIFGASTVRVNSLHHQSLDKVAEDLRVVATAADGIIEAVEYKKPSTFTIGVQWHPEAMTSTNKQMNALFTCLVEASKEKQK